MTYTATATAQGYAFTNNKTLVTASAAATGISEISYEEALMQATELAQDEANITAIYDANLINQAVTEANTIATERMNYNTMQISSPPDLTFYYSTMKKYNDFYHTNLGNLGVKQYSKTPLFSDLELTKIIGYSTSDKTIYTNPTLTEPNNSNSYKYYSFPNGQLVFVGGTIEQILNEEGNYITNDKPNNILTRQIVSGQGEYLNKSGIITISMDNNLGIRKLDVYLNNY